MHKLFISIFLTVVLFGFNSVLSQQLPEFIVYDRYNEPGDYFSRNSFYENESKKIGNDYLFTSAIRPQNIKDSLLTDTLFFGFKDIYRIRIKMISFSINGKEYYSTNTFPVRDSLKWKIMETRTDSILFLDSTLELVFTFGKGCLRLCLDKKYHFHKNDTFKILLDTLPQRHYIPITPRVIKSIHLSIDKNQKFMFFNAKEIYPFILKNQSHKFLFNLAGKKQKSNNLKPNIYIHMFKKEIYENR